jgi:hypothetical protein
LGNDVERVALVSRPRDARPALAASSTPEVERREHMAYAPGNATNLMDRVLTEILDPAHKNMKALLRAYFDSTCAYCGKVLGPEDKKCCDHADPALGNQLGNRVLACGDCNDKEKLATPWREFLERKVSNPALRAERAAKIERWIEMHPLHEVNHSAQVLAKADEIRAHKVAFHVLCDELRALIRQQSGS